MDDMVKKRKKKKKKRKKNIKGGEKCKLQEGSVSTEEINLMI